MNVGIGKGVIDEAVSESRDEFEVGKFNDFFVSEREGGDVVEGFCDSVVKE